MLDFPPHCTAGAPHLTTLRLGLIYGQAWSPSCHDTLRLRGSDFRLPGLQALHLSSTGPLYLIVHLIMARAGDGLLELPKAVPPQPACCSSLRHHCPAGVAHVRIWVAGGGSYVHFS